MDWGLVYDCALACAFGALTAFHWRLSRKNRQLIRTLLDDNQRLINGTVQAAAVLRQLARENRDLHQAQVERAGGAEALARQYRPYDMKPN